MNGFEAAIRNALERSDRTNPEIRARIYHSARHALEAGLRKQGVTDTARIAAQRRWLEQLIATVEAAERQAAAAPAPGERPAARVEPEFSASRQPAAARETGAGSAPRREPGFASLPDEAADDAYADDDEDDDLRASRAEAVPDGEMLGGFRGREGMVGAAEPVARPRRKRGVFARSFIYLVLFLTFASGAAWLYISGALISPSERDMSVPNPPPQVEEEDFAGTGAAFDPQGGFSGDWVELFTPESASRLKVGPAARVEVQTTAGGPAIRITATQAGRNGDVTIDVPVDVLSRMAGKTSTVALTMQSATSGSAEVSVQCQFGSLGACERHRFTASQEKFDALFKVTLPRGLTPGTPGRLTINPALGEGGKSINLFSVRLLPG